MIDHILVVILFLTLPVGIIIAWLHVHHGLFDKKKENNNSQISDNEGKARQMLEIAVQSGAAGSMFHAFKLFGWKPPTLSDKECVEIAKNFPARFKDIRTLFPRIEDEKDDLYDEGHKGWTHLKG